MKLTMEQLKEAIREVQSETASQTADTGDDKGAETGAESTPTQRGANTVPKTIAVHGQRAQARKSRDEGDASLAFAGVVRSLANTGFRPTEAVAYARDVYGSDDAVSKALAEGQASAGGFIVPAPTAGELIELLRDETVVRAAGPRMVNLDRGSKPFPRVASGSSAYWVGENQQMTQSEITFGQITLTAKKLASLVPVSTELIEDADPGTDALIRDDMVAGMSEAEDLAYIRGAGSEHSPTGLRYQMDPANIQGSAGTSVANVDTDAKFLLGSLEDANVRNRNQWRILMSPRSKRFLEFIRGTDDQYLYRDEIRQGRWLGIPYLTTNGIPNNLNTNESEVYLVNMADVLLGTAREIRVMSSEEATYTDTGSNSVSAFANDQVVIRTTMRVDIGLRHIQAAACLTGVTWGA